MKFIKGKGPRPAKNPKGGKAPGGMNGNKKGKAPVKQGRGK
jgi:hypothetical protein